MRRCMRRWGAQTDVWSLLNEQRADAGWLRIAADYLRSIDPYQHPITSSWNDHINMTQIEIVPEKDNVAAENKKRQTMRTNN